MNEKNNNNALNDLDYDLKCEDEEKSGTWLFKNKPSTAQNGSVHRF